MIAAILAFVPVVAGVTTVVRVIPVVAATIAVTIAAIVGVVLALGVRAALVAAIFTVEVAHLSLVHIEKWLHHLSPHVDELVHVDIAALVGVGIVELPSELGFHFGSAPFSWDLGHTLFEGDAMVAICVDKVQAEFFINLVLLLLGKLSLRDSSVNTLLSEELSGGTLDLFLGGLSSGEGSHMILFQDLE